MNLPRYPDESPEPEGAGEVRRPASLIAAFWLGVASVVVGFTSLAVSFFMISDDELRALTRQVNEQGQQLTLEQARSVYRATSIIILVIFLVIAALWVLFLFYMRNGRNWARIVVAVVATIWVVITAPSLSSASIVGVLLGVVQLLVLVGTVVCAFLRPSQEYFDAVRQQRSGS